MKTLLILLFCSKLMGQTEKLRWSPDSSTLMYMDPKCKWKVMDTAKCNSYYDKGSELKLHAEMLKIIADDFLEEGHTTDALNIGAKSDSLMSEAYLSKYIFTACKFGKHRSGEIRTLQMGLVQLYAAYKEKVQRYRNKTKKRYL